jgi:hypothetical protein
MMYGFNVGSLPSGRDAPDALRGASGNSEGRRTKRKEGHADLARRILYMQAAMAK